MFGLEGTREDGGVWTTIEALLHLGDLSPHQIEEVQWV
jgi:hypothetical protein